MLNSEVNRFTLEEQIMSCWNVVDDLKVVYEMSDLRTLTEDELANALLGIITIYQMKFEKLQNTFQKMVQEKLIE